MKRKTIGVCVTGFDWECETRVVYGIYKRCMELDINVLIFSNLIHNPELNSDNVLPESVIHGEIEIYNLINYDYLDGIIIFGDSILQESVLLNIVERAKAHNIPVINVNDIKHNVCRNVTLSDVNAMELVVRHLVEEHGLTKINFVSGFKGNPQSEERIEAYKKVLSEHGIPVEPSRIAYGEFWHKAYDCMEQFMSSDDRPQAVVCANDTMALFCMEYCKDHGYSIPGDVIVTGFDAVADSEIYSPSVTTVRRGFQESGAAAVDMIVDICNGKDVPQKVSVPPVLLKNQSCGCAPFDITKRKGYFDIRYGDLNRFKEFNHYLHDLNTDFAKADSSEQLYLSLKKGAEFFHLKKLFVCICSDVENKKRSYDCDEGISICNRISPKMVSMFKYGHDVPVGTEFPSEKLIPDLCLDGDEPVVYAFNPLYFKDTFLGYLAYVPGRFKGVGDLFATWEMSISNNAGSFYMNKELGYVVDELENLYLRDPLTGLYNRRGMSRLGYPLIDKAKKCGEWITIICADVDNLKPINDAYGHEAGDNAITRTAKAIENSVPSDSICTRTGGDEYCIIMAHQDDKSVQAYISAIDECLEEYNETSGLPYKVGCSCGYYSIHSSELISLDQMIKTADENMYKVKSEKKVNR